MAEITEGASASITRQITEEDVVQFARLTGDDNPMHLDEAFAAQTRFGKRIAHGLLSVSLIGTLFGTRLPGPGSIYLGQTLSFKAPVYIGDTITATVTATNVRHDKPVATFSTVCTNQDGQVVIDGEAVLLYPQAGDGT
jgi:acyl dehydratase